MARMTGKQIDGAIKRVHASGVKYRDLIQSTALACLEHAEEHGDVTKFERLCEAVVVKNYVVALKLWAATFSPIRFNGDDKARLMKSTAKGYTAFNVAGAEAEPFWTMEPEVVKPNLTLAAMLKIVQGLSAKIDKAHEDEKLDGNVVELKAWAARVAAVAAETAPTSDAPAGATVAA